MAQSAPIAVAHRGWHGAGRPENSVEAAQYARQQGLHWSECDVWLSSDGHVAVMHDEKLERTSSGTGSIRAQKWEALRQLKLRDETGAMTPCTLPDLRRLRDGSRISLMVEIKPKNARALVRKVIDIMREESTDWMLQGFDPANLRHARDYDPHIRIACLVGKPEPLEEAIAARWPAIHVEHSLLNEDTHRRIRASGAAVGVWTVNEQRDLERIAPFSPYVIITDRPDRVAAFYRTEVKPAAPAGR